MHSAVDTVFLALVLVAFASFALTLMGVSIYVALGETAKPKESAREITPAKRVALSSPASV